VTSNPDFKVTIIQRQITREWYSIELYLQWPTNRKSYNMIYRVAPFWMTLTSPTSGFKVMSFFDAEYLRNGTIYRHSFNGILIGTYTRPTQQCHLNDLEWTCVTYQNIQWHEASCGLSQRQLSFLYYRAPCITARWVRIARTVLWQDVRPSVCHTPVLCWNG